MMGQDMANEKEKNQSVDLESTSEQIIIPRKILVVDDELFQLQKFHVQDASRDFYDTIADINDPIFSDLWNVAKAIPNIGADQWDEDQAAEYFMGDSAISEVILSEKFESAASHPLKKLLGNFIAKANRVKELKQMFEEAFPSPLFELQFSSAPRPNLALIMQYDAVFLDLFLEHSDHTPVDTLLEYLRTLVDDADIQLLPPIVLMSLHHELKDHRRRFSEEAGISAAGLMVLPKEVLTESEFGSAGLLLSFKQLDRQKNVAHAMRLFIRSWLSALDVAKGKTARTLWNLDASAMQQVHLASVSDDDPYHEHLNELLSREHLFHVEAEPNIVARVAELDKCFSEQLTSEGKIQYRLVAPMADVDTARAFMSHFSWLGTPLPKNFLCNDEYDGEKVDTGIEGIKKEEGENIKIASLISHSLPFGSVLFRDVDGHHEKCLIHITQQCDLNDISREKDMSRTLIFATANVTKLLPTVNPIIGNSELVVKSLRFTRDGKNYEFDLKVNAGEIIALPLCEFMDKARSEKWQLVGRLRSDICNHIVAANTNHMSRPASQKMFRPALLQAKIFLQVKNPADVYSHAKTFSLSLDDKKYSFQDEACIEIALWLTHKLKITGESLDPDALAVELSRSWKSGALLVGKLPVKIKDCEKINQAADQVRGEAVKAFAQLVIVCGK